VQHILDLENLSNRMWSAEETIEYDGWSMRFAGGYTRRPNSVSVLQSSCLNIEEKIDRCEHEYRSRGLDETVFKFIPEIPQPDVENALVKRGYGFHGMHSVQTANLNHLDLPEPTHYYSELNDQWMQAFEQMKGLTPKKSASHQKILKRIHYPSMYSYVMRDDKIVSVGLAVSGEGYCGIFDVVTDEAYRGQGLAREMMLQLLAFGKQTQAHTAYLQMTRDNTAAWRLYLSLGFTEVYQYFYRIKLNNPSA
jgi:N-acetylglutamate synthase